MLAFHVLQLKRISLFLLPLHLGVPQQNAVPLSPSSSSPESIGTSNGPLSLTNLTWELYQEVLFPLSLSHHPHLRALPPGTVPLSLSPSSLKSNTYASHHLTWQLYHQTLFLSPSYRPHLRALPIATVPSPSLTILRALSPDTVLLFFHYHLRALPIMDCAQFLSPPHLKALLTRYCPPLSHNNSPESNTYQALDPSPSHNLTWEHYH